MESDRERADSLPSKQRCKVLREGIRHVDKRLAPRDDGPEVIALSFADLAKSFSQISTLLHSAFEDAFHLNIISLDELHAGGTSLTKELEDYRLSLKVKSIPSLEQSEGIKRNDGKPKRETQKLPGYVNLVNKKRR